MTDKTENHGEMQIVSKPTLLKGLSPNPVVSPMLPLEVSPMLPLEVSPMLPLYIKTDI